MSSQASKLIESCEENIQDTLECWGYVLDRRGFDLAASNLGILVREHLTLGLLHWRQGIDPSMAFQAGLDHLEEKQALLQRLEPSWNFSTKMPMDLSIYMAYLLGRNHPKIDLESCHDHLVAEAFFGNTLLNFERIENWSNYADRLSDKEQDLARRTYNLYASLLSGDISPEDGVSLGEKLYAQRENDDYFSESSGFDGGGSYNLKVVDFRLAAILKKIGSKIPTIHAWRW